MDQEIRLRAVARAFPSTSCEALTLDKGDTHVYCEDAAGKNQIVDGVPSQAIVPNCLKAEGTERRA